MNVSTRYLGFFKYKERKKKWIDLITTIYLCLITVRLEKYGFFVLTFRTRMVLCSRKCGVCYNITYNLSQLTVGEINRNTNNKLSHIFKIAFSLFYVLFDLCFYFKSMFSCRIIILGFIFLKKNNDVVFLKLLPFRIPKKTSLFNFNFPQKNPEHIKMMYNTAIVRFRFNILLKSHPLYNIKHCYLLWNVTTDTVLQ